MAEGLLDVYKIGIDCSGQEHAAQKKDLFCRVPRQFRGCLE
jgi:hypothetical protein